MRRDGKELLLVGLGVVFMLSLAPVAWGQDADGDGVVDANDICPATDPQWPVTAEGCADRDQDGVSDYKDKCPGSDTRFTINEIGCREKRYFRVITGGAGPFPRFLYYGYPRNGRTDLVLEGYNSRDFVLEVPVDMGGGANRLVWWDPEIDPGGQVWFRAYDDGHAELWHEGQVAVVDPCLVGAGTYDLDANNPTDPCRTTTWGMVNSYYNGITVTAFEVFDTDQDGVMDYDDNCADTPLGAVMDPCNLGCPAPDSDGDGVPDYQPFGCGDPDIDGKGGTDDFWFSYYCDQCPDSDPCYPVDIDGCLDTDGDGCPDTEDQCPGSPLGATVSIDGCTDADGDGVPMPYDKCEDTPGGSPVNENGCTDTDADGVADTDDNCAASDPCYPVDDNGCTDRDEDGVADTADACPDQGGAVCLDGCPDANDTDADGVIDCLDLCNDPCLPVNAEGCWDSDQDGVADTDDWCPDTSAGRVVDPCGCDTKPYVIDTIGPIWAVYHLNGRSEYNSDGWPFGWVFDSWMGESVSNLILFGNNYAAGPDNAASLNWRANTDGTTDLWLPQDVAYWNTFHARPGGCPLTGSRELINSGNYQYDPCPHPTTRNIITIESCPLCPKAEQQDGFTVLIVENIDTDGDGVQDPIDQCPGSDPNLVIGDDGCVYVPICDDPWHPSPAADIDGDCYVDPNDLVLMAEQWLSCTQPLADGCIQLQPSPQEMYPNLMYMPQCWAKTVDGHLSDWTDPCWVDLDLVYWSSDMSFPNDIGSAKYTVCWDPCNDKLYSAIVVEDACDYFETGPTNWDTSDRVEIYVQADPNEGDEWGSEQSAYFDKAQQYAVGYQNIVPGWTWAVFGNGSFIPDKYVPGNAEFDEAGRLNGSMIQYEIGAKAFVWYGGRTIPVGSLENVVRELEPGIHVGFDIVADSRWGAESYEFGMVSANLDTQKYILAERFQRWELLDYDGSIVPPQCGDWGMLSADINPTPDCYVDLADFTEMTIGWMNCTDPLPPCGYKSTQPF